MKIDYCKIAEAYGFYLWSCLYGNEDDWNLISPDGRIVSEGDKDTITERLEDIGKELYAPGLVASAVQKVTKAE